MKWFFIKKAFFDGWDNLISMVVLNLIFVALVMGFLAVFGYLMESMMLLSCLLIALLLFLWAFFMGGVSYASYEWSNYSSSTFSAFKTGLVRNFRHSMLYFAILVFQIVLTTIVMPFYAAQGNVVTLLITVLLFWMVVILLLALPYYFPLMCRLPGDRPLKTLKKCFIILIDNPGFSIFFFIYNIICAVLTIATFGLVPGFAGMQLASQDAIKLIMMKYDYLEEAGDDADRKHIPWPELLEEEKEKVGPRSLKSMIFPWK